MKISIITVCYNAAATIADTLNSVASQDYPDFEHIIVDGASTDATMEVVAHTSHPRLRAVSEPDKGLYDAMNKGVAMATGDIIGFLNADDFYCRTDALRLIAGAFARHPAAAAVTGGVAIVDATDIARITRGYSGRFAGWMLYFGHMPPHPGMYVKSEMFRRVGKMDVSYRICGDLDWMVRFYLLHRLKSVALIRTLVTQRDGGLSTQGWQSRVTINREAAAALRKHGKISSPVLIWSRYLLKLSQLFVRPADYPAPDGKHWRPSTGTP
jgi:glycosyltransferase involved in cell wall biosynthesis